MKKILSIILTSILFISGLGAGASLLQETTLKQPVLLDEYDMVIIAPEMFSDVLQPLLAHKNTVGIQTFLKTTEEIYTEYDGRDEAEQIKYYLYEAVETLGISYVLLIGDVDTLPIRTTEVNHIWPGADLIQVDNIITDLYYADIFDAEGNFSSWDSNNDNVFSEFYLYNMGENPGEIEVVDEVDLYPDIGVGRIPCGNDNELANVIDKIISYETQSFGEWFHRLILAGEDGFPEPGYQCEMITDWVGELLKNFTSVKLYESLGTLKPRLINKELNTGAGLFLFFAHGRHMAIANYHKLFIKGLNNIDKLPVAFIGGCYNAQLDASVYSLLIEFGLVRMDSFLQFLGVDTTKLQRCIAWEFLKYEKGGSIATIGSTRKGHLNREDPLSSFGGLLIIKFFESYEPGIKLSEMYIKAVTSFINDTWKDYMTLQEIIILGDPSLKIGGYPAIYT
ncbi:hypothetical protein AYK25_02495 [Thermoplasmatales archaeon SM1-50]|nr:MAG: hypothetical protein AYK25_02495 [Thermoplasmatales archaeon SM1-50]